MNWSTLALTPPPVFPGMLPWEPELPVRHPYSMGPLIKTFLAAGQTDSTVIVQAHSLMCLIRGFNIGDSSAQLHRIFPAKSCQHGQLFPPLWSLWPCPRTIVNQRRRIFIVRLDFSPISLAHGTQPKTHPPLFGNPSDGPVFGHQWEHVLL